MSDNPNNYFQIPTGDHKPDSNQPIYNNMLENIYETYRSSGQSIETPTCFQSETERMEQLALDRLLAIGSEIEAARTKAVQ